MAKLPHTQPAWVIFLFFIIGVLSAVSFRLLSVVNVLTPELFRPLWYFGILGYILFFAYRFSISRKRKKAIRDHRLLEKLESGKPLSPEEKVVVGYLLASIMKSRENLNYLIIFILSVLAVLFDILLLLRT